MSRWSGHKRLTMRLSDAGLRRHPTKLIYPNHPLPPWLTEDTTPRSLEPMVRSLAIWAPLRLAGYPVMISVHLYIWAMRKKVLCFSARFHLRTVCAPVTAKWRSRFFCIHVRFGAGRVWGCQRMSTLVGVTAESGVDTPRRRKDSQRE